MPAAAELVGLRDRKQHSNAELIVSGGSSKANKWMLISICVSNVRLMELHGFNYYYLIYLFISTGLVHNHLAVPGLAVSEIAGVHLCTLGRKQRRIYGLIANYCPLVFSTLSSVGVVFLTLTGITIRKLTNLLS